MPWLSTLVGICFLIGFLCLSVLLKLGAWEAYAEFGLIAAILLCGGALIGVLPIGFLFDRQERRRQRQSGSRFHGP